MAPLPCCCQQPAPLPYPVVSNQRYDGEQKCQIEAEEPTRSGDVNPGDRGAYRE